MSPTPRPVPSAPSAPSLVGEEEYSGQRLGLPPTGPGSLASLGRRVPALAVDWAACLLICTGLLGMPMPATGVDSFLPTLVLLLENVLLVGTLGSTLGHRLLGMRVVRLDGSAVPLLASIVRAVLLVLVIPAVVWGADGRGFHDRLAGTVLVRT